MKKAIGIIILGLMWCNVGVAKDLTGIILNCPGKNKDYSGKPSYWRHMYIDFTSDKDARVIKHKGFGVSDEFFSYTVTPTKIYLYGSTDNMTINREDVLLYGWGYCRMDIDKDFDMKKDIEEKAKEAIDAQEKINKI